MKVLSFIVMFVILNSCGPISVNRSFLEEMQEHEDRGVFVPGKSFETVPGDEGSVAYERSEMLERTPMKSEDLPSWDEAQKVKTDLNYKISQLDEEQRNWFKRNEGLFSSDSKKLYFLNLEQDQRDEYLRMLASQSVQQTNRRVPASYFKYSPRNRREVALGMGKDQVSKIWGNPHRVDVAGDPRYENERWTFYEGSQKRYVYFSQGKVEGWVTE